MIDRFLSGQRGLTLATVDRLADVLGLRLVEGAKVRGRPKAARKSGAVAEGPPTST